MITFGLIINPYAGIGGAVGLKGSDQMIDEAFRRGAQQKAMARTYDALKGLTEHQQGCRFITCPGDMGQSVLDELDFDYALLPMPTKEQTSAADTQQAVTLMAEQPLDVLVFAGGDGTARDILAALDKSDRSDIPVLGIPAGVKIHSGVYGITPQASGEVLQTLLQGGLVDIKESEVRDLDEEAFRQDKVIARHYGEMRVPQVGHFVQAVKQGGVESEELVLADIAAYMREQMEDQPQTLFLIGSGKTTQAIMEELGLDNTLLGVDAVFSDQNGHPELLANDLNEQQILQLFEQYPIRQAVLSIMGGQGHITGRGNQQFSAQVLKQLGKANICLVSTKTKLTELNGRSLIMDSGDAALNQEWAGTIEVITGYRDSVVQPIS
ncbi:ATP-NAD kinase family protein [Bacterioplanoides sp.]|uniref:ATP-NAD kinase family protein n=1 Tax=Bacterioplanoides sp. TaxID=2066072 RepID=UPI003B00C6D0